MKRWEISMGNEQSTKVSCIKVLVTLKNNKIVPVFMPEQVYNDATKCLDYLAELFTEQGWVSQGLAE